MIAPLSQYRGTYLTKIVLGGMSILFVTYKFLATLFSYTKAPSSFLQA